MSTYRLDKLCAPASIAIIGASLREGSLGRALLGNVLQAGFKGRLDLVNPKYTEIDGLACANDISDLAETPDLAVILAPAGKVPGIVEAVGRKGSAAAIVMSSGLGQGPGSLAEIARLAARRYGLRLIGSNSLGLVAPSMKLNASCAARAPLAGDLALISQSGAIAAGIAEWAVRRQVGFSAMISLGDELDVDISDCLDHFAVDPNTRAMLLYVESIRDARKFMSAARAAARIKPVVVIKPGRHDHVADGETHTGVLATSDAVYDSAFRRAGLLRVLDLDELFAAAETLGRQRPFSGKRLALLTNDAGIGVLATDRLFDLGGTLAELREATISKLDGFLPPTWSRVNPVNITKNADAGRYGHATEVLLADDANDALLILNVPNALADAAASVEAVVQAVEKNRAASIRRKPVFAVWLGQSQTSVRAFEQAGISHFTTEAEAVQGFMHLVRYREAQDLLMETPDNLPHDFVPDVAAAQRIVAGVLGDGRSWLNPIEVIALLQAYEIPTVPVTLAAMPDEAVAAARPILDAGGTVAVKICSPDIIHKSDIGGVCLDLTSEDVVRKATLDILARARAKGLRVDGVIVQTMVRRPKARELIAGLADDPDFGPVVVFGRGGTAVELINDKSLALPPLDMKLAEILIARTRVSRILKAYRDVPAADETALRLVLVKLSQLAADVPMIRELDINPLLVDQMGVLALDARARVAPLDRDHGRAAGHPRFAIRPYPRAWERTITCQNGQEVFVRPVRPEDEGMFAEFAGAISEEDLRLRFFAPVHHFSHLFLARLVQVDYARAIAFVAINPKTGEMMGVVRLHADANHDKGEYAVLVRSDLKGVGLGWELMHLIIEWAKADGLRTIEGQVLSDNKAMLEMCHKLGFSIRPCPDDASIRLVSLSIP
ncbi:MAG TPA: bifunctional acetate--CoA ligase family protein/GNAT family N-acetyltransferase [Beijerinckia sp.]|nr:bifunctional acetate--CoA ligase family protein/GNAT family N-acetyltransferase [Beijerinckia sp.]